MLTKKHISALVYVAITLIMIWSATVGEESQRSWEYKGQICNLHPMRSKRSGELTSIDFFLYLTQAK